MILVPKIYAEIVLGFDIIMLIMSLLFRKPKHRIKTSSQDQRSIGYYLVTSTIIALVVGHYASYTNYLDYYEGLVINSFLFYMGLRAVTQK
jgi:hypothetical protein